MHGLAAVLHATEVRHVALVAKVEGAIVLGEASKVVEVNIAFGDDASLPVVALFNSLYCCE